MATDKKLNIELQFDMFTPKDMVGTVEPQLGGALEKVGDQTNPFRQLLNIIENNGRGVLTLEEMVAKINEIKTDKGLGGVDLSEYLTIWSTKECVKLGAQSEKDSQAPNHEGELKKLSSLKEIIGPKFQIDDKQVASIILSKSPFFNPSTRNTKKAEVFLNSMPSTVLAQLVPYMQVEFQFSRDYSDNLQSLSQLKLLLGAVAKKDLKGADAAMLARHISEDKDNNKETTFVGMEAFTSPVTLTNPQPNTNVGTKGDRYADVIDPFRPFASLEHVTISAKPSGAGFFCYKKANLVLKVHDRSRLHEISDLLRPRVYTGVTIWMTYGWRAPSRGTNNPYFAYVNNNLMMREAYHISNSSFSFDNVGQVTVNLELYTKGVAELRQLRITDSKTSDKFKAKEIKGLIEQISHYRQQLRLDPPEGTNKEIRVFQILDAAETGEFPDLKADEVKAKIDALEKSLNQTKGIDKDAANGLITSLRKLYKPDKAGKFDVKQRYETTVTNTVNEMFAEVRTGADPFLPASGKASGDEIAKICDSLNAAAATKVNKGQKTVVSFGKLFSVFALRSILTLKPVAIDEVQVFFYRMNEQCGPISGHSIAEFPIEMNKFLDQFNDLAKSKGGNDITLEDFLQLAINAQFLDKAAVGYGLSEFYQPYAKGKEAALKVGKDVENKFESQVAAFSSKYGPFKQPTIEMYVECSHQRVSAEGESDILQMLAYSAKDASPVGLPEARAKGLRKIMRIHVYDKQTNSYRAAATLLRNVTNTGWISVPSTPHAEKKDENLDHTKQLLKQLKTVVEVDKAGKFKFTGDFVNNQQVKNIVSKLVPVIRFGSNGTTITQANLSSKADPLLSTVQMIRSQTVTNTAQPNGAGSKSGLPLRVLPAQMTMTTLGNPLATMAQQYFIDFQTGTTLDNLYIVTGLTHTFAPGKFDTQWTFGYSDGYGVFEGAPHIVDQIAKLEASIPKDPSPK